MWHCAVSHYSLVDKFVPIISVLIDIVTHILVESQMELLDFPLHLRIKGCRNDPLACRSLHMSWKILDMKLFLLSEAMVRGQFSLEKISVNNDRATVGASFHGRGIASTYRLK